MICVTEGLLGSQLNYHNPRPDESTAISVRVSRTSKESGGQTQTLNASAPEKPANLATDAVPVK